MFTYECCCDDCIKQNSYRPVRFIEEYFLNFFMHSNHHGILAKCWFLIQYVQCGTQEPAFLRSSFVVLRLLFWLQSPRSCSLNNIHSSLIIIVFFDWRICSHFIEGGSGNVTPRYAAVVHWLLKLSVPGKQPMQQAFLWTSFICLMMCPLKGSKLLWISCSGIASTRKD